MNGLQPTATPSRTILTYPGTNSEFVGNQRKRTLVSNYTDCTKREMKTKAEVDYRNKLSFLSWEMMQAQTLGENT